MCVGVCIYTYMQYIHACTYAYTKITYIYIYKQIMALDIKESGIRFLNQ